MPKDSAVHGKVALEHKLLYVMEVKRTMWGGAIFLAFFVLFAAASYAVPVPLFPGSMVPLLGFVTVPSLYVPFVSAIVNGLVYGFVVWLVFMLVSRRFEEPKVAEVNNRRRTQVQRNRKRH